MPGDARHDRLPAELAVGADFARDARHFRGKAAELVDHRVDRFLELQDLAADVDRDLLGEIAVGHGDGDVGDVANLRRQVAGHLVDRLGELLPDTGDASHLRLTAQLALGAHFARDARHFGREHRQLVDHVVDQPRRAEKLAFERPAVDFERHGLPEIALGHRAHRAGHLGRRPHEIVDERVDGRDFIRPAAHHPRDVHALFELALLADRVGHERCFARAPLAEQRDIVEGIGDLAVDAGE